MLDAFQHLEIGARYLRFSTLTAGRRGAGPRGHDERGAHHGALGPGDDAAPAAPAARERAAAELRATRGGRGRVVFRCRGSLGWCFFPFFSTLGAHSPNYKGQFWCGYGVLNTE